MSSNRVKGRQSQPTRIKNSGKSMDNKNEQNATKLSKLSKTPMIDQNPTEKRGVLQLETKANNESAVRAITGAIKPLKTLAPIADAEKKPSKRNSSQSTADSNWKRLKQTLPPPRKVRTVLANDAPISAPALLTIRTSQSTSVDPRSPKILALDCEMVGDEHRRSMLARVCIVNDQGNVIYDKYVRPTTTVTDYRTRYSGIEPHHLTSSKAVSFLEAQRDVAEIIKGNFVVGHGLKNDFYALRIEHPKHLTRDTAHYRHFKSATGQPRKLKHLVLERLSYAIQEGRKGHDPAIDAKAALDLYIKHRDEWEASLTRKKNNVSSRL